MTGICSHCNTYCEAIIMDFGIGPYEYWGAVGVDSNPEVVSNCCWAKVLNSSGWPITIKDLEDELFEPPVEESDHE